jgi:hypothetical protein
MADAGDLKSPALYRACGFDSLPGHQPSQQVQKMRFPQLSRISEAWCALLIIGHLHCRRDDTYPWRQLDEGTLLPGKLVRESQQDQRALRSSEDDCHVHLLRQFV